MKARPDQILALPCSGRFRLGIKRGHLYLIQNQDGTREGYMTLEDARRKYGEEKIFVSGSDSLCPSYFDDIINDTKKINQLITGDRI